MLQRLKYFVRVKFAEASSTIFVTELVRLLRLKSRLSKFIVFTDKEGTNMSSLFFCVLLLLGTTYSKIHV